MRPIDRGPVPCDESGQPLEFAKYQDARESLIQRIGEYCSYCEIHRPDGPDVEHVQPKSRHPDLEKRWDNFLLGCRNCNSIKSNSPIDLIDYFWPDSDNTFGAFAYHPDLPPQPFSGLSDELQRKAEATIKLTGLDRVPGYTRPSDADRRWIKRRDAWGIAQESLTDLNKNDCEEMRRQIILTALGTGFWSVWMTVFKDDSDMRRRLSEAFPGTARNCFNTEFEPVARPGGQV